LAQQGEVVGRNGRNVQLVAVAEALFC